MEEPIIKTRVVGVDISNAVTSYAIVDIRGNIIAMKEFPTKDYPDVNQFVLKLADFEEPTSLRLPLELTASCDIMPFDGQDENIGETAMLNKRGGAIAFFGTTRTVYQSYNRLMNLSFTRHVLSRDAEGRPLPIGEAVRQTKNELISTGIVTGYSNGKPVYSTDKTANKLQYTLLGDPALRLAVPTMSASIDSINGHPASTAQTLPAGSIVTVIGHVSDADGTPATQFNGMVTAVVSDAKQTITSTRQFILTHQGGHRRYDDSTIRKLGLQELDSWVKMITCVLCPPGSLSAPHTAHPCPALSSGAEL